MHRESKGELTDRLRREGRFEEFKKRREELKADGVPASQAWYQSAVEFPAPNGNGANGSAPAVDLTPLKDKPAVSVAAAASWVFEHLDCDWVTPADAPSAGAWSLLQWARSSPSARSEFYRNFANKMALPPQGEQRRTQEKTRQFSARHDKEIEDLLAQSKARQSTNWGSGVPAAG